MPFPIIRATGDLSIAATTGQDPSFVGSWTDISKEANDDSTYLEMHGAAINSPTERLTGGWSFSVDSLDEQPTFVDSDHAIELRIRLASSVIGISAIYVDLVGTATPEAGGPREYGIGSIVSVMEYWPDETGLPIDPPVFNEWSLVIFNTDGEFHDYSAFIQFPETLEWTLPITLSVYLQGEFDNPSLPDLSSFNIIDPNFIKISRLEIGPPLSDSTDHITPTTGPIQGGTTVTVNWASIISGATVTVDDVAVDFDDTEHTFVTPAHLSGNIDIVVTNPDTTSHTFSFRYFAPPVIQPGNSPIQGGVEVKIFRGAIPIDPDGSEFQEGATVSFGGVSGILPLFIDEDTYTVTAPEHDEGMVDVTISNIDSFGEDYIITNGFFFGDQQAAPKLTISPDQTAQGPLTSSVTVKASLSNNILTSYKWTQTAGPETATIVSSTSLVTVINFTVYTAGTYTFRFTASDPANEKAPLSAFTHIILPKLKPPVIRLS